MKMREPKGITLRSTATLFHGTSVREWPSAQRAHDGCAIGARWPFVQCPGALHGAVGRPASFSHPEPYGPAKW